MDGKQLDLYAPLLSVRRLASTSSNSDGMDRKVTEKAQPNRQHSLPVCKSDWELEEVTKPAAVPFTWEQIPGRAKDGNNPLPQPPKEPSNSPRIPQGRQLDIIKQISEEQFKDLNVFSPQITASPLNKGMNATEDLDLENGDDAYSDALETLSSTESFSWKCSESGFSGYDDLDVKSSGTFSMDPQTRDYMMRRFLPAAKAMILETPQYVSKKQTMVTELPRHVKKVYSGELRPLLEQHVSNAMSPYSQYRGDVQRDDEDEAYDSVKRMGKNCGVFPRLCVKNSLHLLNPVPGMKSRTQTPVPSTGDIKRLARRTSFSGPLTPTLEKHTWDDVSRKKSPFQSRELHEVENKLTNRSNQFHPCSDSFRIDGSSPDRASRGGRISPYRNERPRSPFHDGARFLGIPKEVQKIEAKIVPAIKKGRDISPRHIFDQGSSTVSPVAEKTLYIDSVDKVETPRKSVSSKAVGILNPSRKTFVECRVMEESSTPKSFTKDKKCGNILKGETVLKPKAFRSFDVDIPSSDCVSSLGDQGDRNKDLKVDQQFDKEVRSLEYSIVDSNGNFDNTVEGDEQGNSGVDTLQSPLAPTLPKSPSESWLWRTISLRNPFPKKQGQKPSAIGAKWETIVKTSNVHHDHARYSEELLPHVSQHAKT